MTCGIAVIARSQDTTWPRAGGAFSGVPSMIDSLEVEVLYPASGSCVSRPCPPESGPSASDLRGPDDRIVSSERDVRVFHEGNFPSSRFLLIYLDVSCLDPFTNVLPRTTLDPPLLVTRVVRLALQVLLRSPTPAWASLPTSLPLIGLLTRLLAGTQTGLLGSRMNLPYRAVSKHLGTMGE